MQNHSTDFYHEQHIGSNAGNLPTKQANQNASAQNVNALPTNGLTENATGLPSGEQNFDQLTNRHIGTSNSIYHAPCSELSLSGSNPQVFLTGAYRNLYDYAQNVIITCLGNKFTVGPALRKSTAHDGDKWGQYQTIPGIVGKTHEWERATAIYIQSIDKRHAAIEYDDPTAAHDLLKLAPELADNAGHTRDDHGSFIVEFPFDVSNCPLDRDGSEIASIRTLGAIQLVHGAHWDKPAGKLSGSQYVFNGKPVKKLSVESANRIIAYFKVAPAEKSAYAEKPIVPTGDDQERALHNLSYIPASVPRNKWIAIAGILKDLFGDAGLYIFDQWSATCPDKYKPGEPDVVWKSLKGNRRADPRKLSALANEYSNKQAWHDWKAKQGVSSRTAVTNTTPAPITIFSQWADKQPPDVWLGLLRTMGKQCSFTAYVWNVGVKAGAIGEHEGVDAALLANVAVKQGITAVEDCDKAEHTFRAGLENLLSGEVLTTERYSPCCVVKTSSTHSKIYWFKPYQSALDAIFTGYIYPRSVQSEHAGYSKVQDDEFPAQPIRIEFEPDHFMGELAYDEDQAVAAVEDIQTALNLPRDEITRQRMRKYANTTANREYQHLCEDKTVTPIANVQCCNYSQFDAARFRGLIEHSGGSIRLSQKELINFLGVSKATLINLRADAGLKTKQDLTNKISLQPGDIVGQVNDGASKFKGRPILIEYHDPIARSSKKVPYNVQACRDHLDNGRAVEVIYQVASITEVDPAGPRERKRYEPTGTGESRGIVFQRYYGRGYSAAWLWSQVILHLIAAGYAESDVNNLPLPIAIDVARGKRDLQEVRKAMFTHAGYADKQLIDDVIEQAETIVETTIQNVDVDKILPPPPQPTAEQLAALPNVDLLRSVIQPAKQSVSGECPECHSHNTTITVQEQMVSRLNHKVLRPRSEKLSCCDCGRVFDAPKEQIA